MAGSVTIQEHNANDDIQRMTAKLNYNFKSLSTWIASQTDSSQTILSFVDNRIQNLKQSFDAQIGQIREEFKETIDSQVSTLKKEVYEDMNKGMPAKGVVTLFNQDYDEEGHTPSDVWPGTQWLRLGELSLNIDDPVHTVEVVAWIRSS